MKKKCWPIAVQNEIEDLALMVLILACVFLKLKKCSTKYFIYNRIQVLFPLDFWSISKWNVLLSCSASNWVIDFTCKNRKGKF